VKYGFGFGLYRLRPTVEEMASGLKLVQSNFCYDPEKKGQESVSFLTNRTETNSKPERWRPHA